MSTKIRRWLPLIIWIVMIFALSSIPGLSTDDVRLPSGSDKVVHFFEYAIFAMLYYRGLSYGREKISWSIVIVVILSGSAVAGLDEMYQRYIPRRDSSIYDLSMDAAGVMAGTIAAVLRHMLRIRSASGERKAVH